MGKNLHNSSGAGPVLQKSGKKFKFLFTHRILRNFYFYAFHDKHLPPQVSALSAIKPSK